MHVQQHDVGLRLRDLGDRLGHRARVPDERELLPELVPNAAREQLVVLDQEDPDHVARLLGIRSRTSVPWPIALSITATPPLRSMRPSIDSAIPWRSVGTASRENPTP